jgi:hypothetical protein
MESLIVMNAPGAVDSRREFALRFLEEAARSRPGLTWGELVAAARAESGDIGLSGPMNGWLTNAIKVVGGAADTVTFGGASKVLTGIRDIGEDVLAKDKVADSLKRAGQGVFDETLDRFLNALPFGIGKDFKTGYVVNRYWLIAAIVGGVLFLLWLRKK